MVKNDSLNQKNRVRIYLVEIQVKQKFGRLDVILNNAGVATPVGRIHETPMKTVEDAFDLNALGAWKVLK